MIRIYQIQNTTYKIQNLEKPLALKNSSPLIWGSLPPPLRIDSNKKFCQSPYSNLISIIIEPDSLSPARHYQIHY